MKADVLTAVLTMAEKWCIVAHLEGCILPFFVEPTVVRCLLGSHQASIRSTTDNGCPFSL